LPAATPDENSDKLALVLDRAVSVGVGRHGVTRCLSRIAEHGVGRVGARSDEQTLCVRHPYGQRRDGSDGDPRIGNHLLLDPQEAGDGERRPLVYGEFHVHQCRVLRKNWDSNLGEELA
jgi:hypothetical protein